MTGEVQKTNPKPGGVGHDTLVAAVRWAYRLGLGRDPENAQVVADWASLQDPQAVLRHLARSPEAAEVVATGRPPLGSWPEEPADALAVESAWLLLRGRRPTDEEVKATLNACPDGTSLREMFLSSPEYAEARSPAPLPLAPVLAPPMPATPPAAAAPITAPATSARAWGDATVTLEGHPLTIRGHRDDAYWQELRHGAVEASVLSLHRVTRAHLADGGRGAVLMDAGANIGLASLAMALAAPQHAVLLAVEPDADSAAHLRHNLRVHGAGRARVEELALGARTGRAEFLADAGNSATGHLLAGRSATEGIGRLVVSVPVQRLDRLLADHGCERLDVLKVDVEGGEDAVLAGAGDLLARHRTLVHIEFNMWTMMAVAGANPRRVLENWAASFPHIVAFGDDGTPWPLTDQSLLMWFLYVTTTKRGGIGDLVLCHDVEWLRRWR